MHAVILFLYVEGYSAAGIHQQMSGVYSETFMSDRKVWKWCRNFEAGCTDSHGKEQMSTTDFVQWMNRVIWGNRQFRIFILSDSFPKIQGWLSIPQEWEISVPQTVWEMGSQDGVWPSQNTVNGHCLYIYPVLLWWTRFFNKLSQGTRHGFIKKKSRNKIAIQTVDAFSFPE